MGEHCSPTVKLSHRTCMGAAQFLLCRNATSRYFLPVELLVNVTKMYPKIIWHQRYDKHGIIPPNGTPRASSPTMFRASLLCRKIATLFADFTLFNGIEQSGAEIFFSDTALLFLLLCYAFKSFSALLVGLRLLRLCLKLRRGFAP